MTQRIDMITQLSKVYTYETYLSNQLEKAFSSQGVECKKISLDRNHFGNYLQSVWQHPPAWTVSFIDLFPGEAPLCDVVGAPHFCLPRLGLSEVFSCLRASLGHLGIFDQSLCTALKNKGFSNVLYLPPAIDPDMGGFAEEEKCFSVVLFEDLIDPVALKKTWQVLFSPFQCVILEKAIEICQEQSSASSFQVLYQILEEKGSAPEEVPFSNLHFSIEEYLKAVRIRAMIESIENTRVDVFGEHVGNNWLRKLKNKENVFLHWSLPYTEYFEVLKRSKILLRNPLGGTDGNDEWLLPAYACDCLTITNATSLLKEIGGSYFPFYESFKDMNTLLHHFLADVKKRHALIRSVKEKMREEYTWQKRAEILLDYFSCHQALVL